MRTRSFVSIGSLAVVAIMAAVAFDGVALLCAQSNCAVSSTPRGWGKGKEVRYNVSALPDDGSENSPRKQARRAFEKWHNANQSNGSGVKFKEVTSGTTEFTVISASAGGKRAQTTLTVGSGASNEATLSAQAKLDLGNTQFFDPAQPGYANAIEKAMLHEIGHSMGLSSPTEETCSGQTAGGSVMNCASGVNDSNGLTALEIQSCDQAVV